MPRRFAHVAYAGLKLFKPATTDNPTYQVIMFFDEEFEENKAQAAAGEGHHHPPGPRRRRPPGQVRPQQQLLRRMEEGGVRRRGLPGEAPAATPSSSTPAAARTRLENRHGAYVTSYSLFVALSANGKTSTTCRCWPARATSAPG